MNERESVREILYGKGVHVAMLDALEGIDKRQAGLRPSNAPHSVFQILHHMIFWQDFVLASLAGKNPTPPKHAAESWTEAASPPSTSAWKETIQQFATGLQHFTELLSMQSTDLDRVVNQQSGQTVRDQTLSIILHNSHHLGQIITLRQQIGAWPPPKGGNTW